MQNFLKFVSFTFSCSLFSGMLYCQSIKETFDKKNDANLSHVIKSKKDTIRNFKRQELPDSLKKILIQKIEEYKKANPKKEVIKSLKNTADADCCGEIAFDLNYSANGNTGTLSQSGVINTSASAGVFINAAIYGGYSCNNYATFEIFNDPTGAIYTGSFSGLLASGQYLLIVKLYSNQTACNVISYITINVECDCPPNNIVPEFTIKNVRTNVTTTITNNSTYTINCDDQSVFQATYSCSSNPDIQGQYTYTTFNTNMTTPMLNGSITQPFHTPQNYQLIFNSSNNPFCNSPFTVNLNVLNNDCCILHMNSDTNSNDRCGDGGFESGILNTNDWKYYYGSFLPGISGGFYSGNCDDNNMEGYPHFWSAGLNTNINSNYEMPLTCMTCAGTPVPASQVHHRIESAGNDLVVGSLLQRTHVGNYSMRLGNAAVNYGIEKVEKVFTVTNSNCYFGFWYALVMGKPGSDHFYNTIPTFMIQVKDITNPSLLIFHNDLANLSANLNYISSQDPILNSTYNYTNACTNLNSTVQTTEVVYKSWSFQQIDLHTLIGKKVSIEIITRDCGHCGHFSYAYLDDFCSQADATNPTGSISLGNTDSCGSNGNICVNYSLPFTNTATGTVKLFLDIFQNGNFVTTLNSGSTALNAGTSYCFSLTSAVFALLNNPNGKFDYVVRGDFELNNISLPSQYIGIPNTGHDATLDNDYSVSCPPPCPTCQPIVTIYPENGGPNITCSTNGITLQCNKNYFLGAVLDCGPADCSVTIKKVEVYDTNNNTTLWAGSLTTLTPPGIGRLNIPAGLTGTFYIKYTWGTATADCGTVIYPVTITCPCDFTITPLPDKTICKGISTEVGSYPVAGLNYSWTSNPAGFTSSSSNPTVNPTVTTTYTLTVTNGDPNCPAQTDEVTVIVDNCCDPTCNLNLSIKDLVTNQITVCNTVNTEELSCGTAYDFISTITCNPVNSIINIKQVTVTDALGQPVAWAASFILANGVGSLSIPATAATGVYTVTYSWGTSSLVCGITTYTFNCVQPNRCCEGGNWTSKKMTWSNIVPNTHLSLKENEALKKKSEFEVEQKNNEMTKLIGDATLNPLPLYGTKNIACNISDTIMEGSVRTFSGTYSCNPALTNCTSEVLISITTISGDYINVLNQTAPYTQTFTLPGKYEIKYTAKCGGKACDSCTFTLVVNKNCCAGGIWKKAEYEIVNKKADGSWNFGGLQNLLSSPSAALKTTTMAVNIENLDYSCAQGCGAGYIIKRKDMTTMVETTEVLPPGQVSTSIYATNHIILVRVIPVCGGQSCTNQLIFRVGCKDNSCTSANKKQLPVKKNN